MAGAIAARLESEARSQEGGRVLRHGLPPLLSEMRFVLRSVRKSAGFSIAVVLLVAVGVGAATVDPLVTLRVE